MCGALALRSSSTTATASPPPATGSAFARPMPPCSSSAPELWEALRDGLRRRTPDAVTMFKSVGAATQDLAVAARAVELARKQGLGQDVGEFPVLRKHN